MSAKGPFASYCTADYSITSSVVPGSIGGTARPSTFAVLRLITSSSLVGCATGKSSGLVPFTTPVTFPSSRFKLETRLSLTGSQILRRYLRGLTACAIRC